MLVDAGGAGARRLRPRLRRLRDRRRPGRHHPRAPAGGAGLRVALMEGGGLDLEPESQALYEGEVVGLDYYALEDARLRMFGGTSMHWGGRCRPLEASDFLPALLRAAERLADPQGTTSTPTCRKPTASSTSPSRRGVRPAARPGRGRASAASRTTATAPDPLRRQVPGRDRGEREDHLRGQRQPRRPAARRRPRHDDRGALPLLRARGPRLRRPGAGLRALLRRPREPAAAAQLPTASCRPASATATTSSAGSSASTCRSCSGRPISSGRSRPPRPTPRRSTPRPRPSWPSTRSSTSASGSRRGSSRRSPSRPSSRAARAASPRSPSG